MPKQFVFSFWAALFWAATATAQFDFTSTEPDGSKYVGGPRRGASQTQIWRAGIVLEPGTAMDDVQITVPVPADWYEQNIVNINEEKMDAGLAGQIRYRNINGGAWEMSLQLGKVNPIKPVEIIVAFEVQNYELLPPDSPDQYMIPKRVPKEIKPYLQESPCIESHNGIFTKMFHEITKDRKTDWEKVEAVYSFVQNNVKYDDEGWRHPAKGALAVVKMPKGEWLGDCKDMSCLFTALCRAGKVPARIVRVPEHCYAEFYLELKQDTKRNEKPVGFWFPCQVSGTYAFGGIPEKRVILQKGDSFPDYDNPPKGKTLFLQECFQGTQATNAPRPKFKWIHEATAK